MPQGAAPFGGGLSAPPFPSPPVLLCSVTDRKQAVRLRGMTVMPLGSWLFMGIGFGALGDSCPALSS